MKYFHTEKLLVSVLFFALFSESVFAQGGDDDTVDLPPVTVTGSPWNPAPNIPIPSFPGLPGGDGTGGISSGGGSGASGLTPENPKSTPGESSDCPSAQTMRIARASEQIRAAVGAIGCVQQRHRNRFWEVNFPDGKSGVYFGVGDCRSSLNNTEITNPGC